MSFSGGGQGHNAGEEYTGVCMSRQSGSQPCRHTNCLPASHGTQATHPGPTVPPPQQPVLPWTLWPPRTHHGCSVGSLVSDVQDSTAFSWILALRARAWAPNLRARLRQDWSSERESFEGT